jgi:hypothetical protein
MQEKFIACYIRSLLKEITNTLNAQEQKNYIPPKESFQGVLVRRLDPEFCLFS